MRSLTSSGGSVTDQYDYTAFGELKSYSGSSTPNNYQYTGQQFDDEIDLYSLRARYYDASNGRFLSRDSWPIDLNNPIELNRYVYTANNPVNFSDPSGHTLGETGPLVSSGGTTTVTASTLLAKYTWQGFIWAMTKSAVAAIAGYAIALGIHNERTGEGKQIEIKEVATSGLIGMLIGGTLYFYSTSIKLGSTVLGISTKTTLASVGVASFLFSILSWYIGVMVQQAQAATGIREGYRGTNVTLTAFFEGLIAFAFAIGLSSVPYGEAAKTLAQRLGFGGDVLGIAIISGLNTLRRLGS